MKAKKNNKIHRNPKYCSQAIFFFAGWTVIWKISRRSIKVEYKSDNTHEWKLIGYGNSSSALCRATIYATHPTQCRSRLVIANWLNELR